MLYILHPIAVGLLLMLAVVAPIHAQPYQNEWINYDLTYYKITTNEEGLHRITFDALSTSGGAMTGADFKMFHQGEQIPIYVSSNGILGTGDYIEFYGEPNDGEFDTQLYLHDIFQPHPHRSLFTGIATYYLTSESGGEHLRFEPMPNDLTGAPAAESYFMHTEYANINGLQFYSGSVVRISGTNVNFADFEEGEGFVSSTINIGEDLDLSIPVTAPYTGVGAPPAILNTRVAGRSNALDTFNDHHLQIRVDGTLRKDTTYEGYTLKQFNIEIPDSDISAPSLAVNYESVGGGALVNKNSVCYARLSYPRQFDFGNRRSFRFGIENDGDKYLEINNFNGGGAPFLYDLTNGLRIEPVVDNSGTNNVYQFLLTQVADGEPMRDLVLINTTSSLSVETVNAISSTTFTNYALPENAGDYLILTHPTLRGGGTDWVEAYADYRSSEAGGSYNVVVVNIEELYDQYAWGIQKHPLAIRNFVNYIVATWTEMPPQYLFLLGKAVSYEKLNTGFDVCLVPSYGHKASDIMLSTPNILSYRPQLATGRIPASTPDEVRIYLDKVMAYEAGDEDCTREDRLWRKKALHIAGGNNDVESTNFLTRLNEYKDIYEAPQFGGSVVKTYNRISEEAVGGADGELDDIINEGLAVINFVGHSASSFWNVDIEGPDNYTNYNKLPFIITSSCFVGNIHDTPNPTAIPMPIEYVFAEDLGAIAFLATADVGFPTYLNIYTTELYERFCNLQYNQSLGTCVKDGVAQIHLESVGTSTLNGVKVTAQEYTLTADPAIIVGGWSNAEFLIENNAEYSDVFFEPAQVTPEIAEFAINVVVTNLGMGVMDSFNIHVERTLPDGTVETAVHERVPATAFVDTFTFNIPTGDIETVEGDNLFTVSIDHDNEIMEDCEDNNIVTKSLTIFSDLLIPISPCQYAIVNEPDVVLYASTGQPMLEELAYVMQLDTTANFDSPFLRQFEVNAESGVIEWQPDVAWQNQTVYYWRAAPVPIPPDVDHDWKSASFVYLPDSPLGWNQSHYYQFLENDFEQLSINPNNRVFEYPESESVIDILNNQTSFTDVGVSLDGTPLYESVNLNGNCLGGVTVLAFKPGFELEPMYSYKQTGTGGGCNGRGQFGNVHATPDDLPYFEFYTADADQLDALANFLVNEVPDGYYVAVMSIYEHLLQANPGNPSITAIHQFFIDMGIPQFAPIIDSTPFIAFGQKGVATFPAEFVTGMLGNNDFDLQITVNNRATSGNLYSPPIGPSQQWHNLQLLHTADDGAPEVDELIINVYGLDASGNQLLLNETTTANNDFDISFIDAEIYPFIRLEARTADSLSFSPPQLEYWRVLFDRYPEIGLDRNDHFVFHADTLQEGESLLLDIAVTNMSNFDMDSLWVRYSIIDDNNVANVIPHPKDAPVLAGETIITSFEHVTTGLEGSNILMVELNPNGAQSEKLSFNNVMFLPFYVNRDKINPFIDVTFDGRHILDGELVSAKPEINVRIQDENRFLALDDTASFSLVLRYPDATGMPTLEKAVYFANSWVTFIPPNTSDVSEGNNTARIVLSPDFADNGTYELVVSAKDRSGNKFALSDYRVAFEVITESYITNILNYPNPFTSSTRFVFTLTGSEVPEFFKIQIMTVSGKVVRELTQVELGAIHIGHNITDFAWDGTDEYGNALANGLYLYRVVTRLNGENLSKYELESTKKLFTKGTGKMYLMR